MTGYLTVNFSETEEGLFSTREILRLMRVEYERARRYVYPASLMVVEVDRLEYLHNLYGWESKEEILQSVIKLLRSTTRDSDFLGCLQDDRILAVFPHTSEEAIAGISARLLRSCRDLDFRTEGRILRATLSVGLASLTHDDLRGFDEFVETAHEGLSFAVKAGGDRFVRRQTAQTVITELRGEIEEAARHLEEEKEKIGTVLEVPEEEVTQNSEFADRIHQLFLVQEGRTLDIESIEQQVTALTQHIVKNERDTARAQAASEHLDQVDLLERRVVKLKELLDKTEADLVLLANSKSVDPGIASIYRTVQGLQADARDSEEKREMLSLIFEANLELQSKLRDESR